MPYDFVLGTTAYLDPRERPDKCTDAARSGRSLPVIPSEGAAVPN